jgi:transcriptional regulator with XRE-family HTH domain
MPNLTNDQERFYRAAGLQIQQARKGRMTQAQLARASSLTRTSITNIEKGRQKIFLHTLFDIALALGVEPTTLLPQEKQMESRNQAAELPNDLKEKDRALIQRAIKIIKKGM